jgi:hypothetical protein
LAIAELKPRLSPEIAEQLAEDEEIEPFSTQQESFPQFLPNPRAVSISK